MPQLPLLPLRLLSVLALGIAPALAAGCVSDISGPDQQTLWTATLEGAPDHPAVTGSAAAVSSGRVTEAGITLQGLVQGTFSWRVRRGRCADPGEVLGAEDQYPDVVVGGAPDEGGGASAEGVIGGGMVIGERYHAEVRSPSAGPGGGPLVACGDFQRDIR